MKKHIWYLAALGVVVVAPLSIWAQNATRPQRPAVVRFQPTPDASPEAEGNAPVPPAPQPPMTEPMPEKGPMSDKGSRPGDPGTGRAAPRDPTTVDPSLRPILDPSESTRAPLPAMKLRGRIVHGDGRASVLIDIDKQYFTVEKGSRIDVGSHVLEVTSITNTEVAVKVEDYDRIIRLR